jgi:hypothetical protein
MLQSRSTKQKIRSLVFAALLAASVGASANQAKPPAIPAAAGTASGTVQAGPLTITLAHAYVSGPLDPDDVVYQVVLTDAPLPEAAIDRELRNGGGQALLRAGKVSGISLLVDAKGFVRNVVPFIGSDLRGSRMLASAGTLPSFTVKGGRATGQGQQTTEQTNQGWSYSASWNATLRPPAK